MSSEEKKPLVAKQNVRDINDGEAETGPESTEVFVFAPPEGLTSSRAQELMDKYGRNELPEKTVPKWYIFLSLFWQPMPIMIWIAIFIEYAINNPLDMTILLIIQFANASIAFYEINKAGDAVAALKASLKPEATVKRDGAWKTIDAALIVPGDLVLLASGSAIPADGRVNHGQIDVDQSQLTGESLPVTCFKGDKVMMGSTVARGEVEGTVEFTGADTFFGKTASLLAQTAENSNLQNILMAIMIVLVVVSLAACTIVYLYLIQSTDVVEALSFVVVLMVASIPLAIEIVTTTTLAVGSKDMSKHGAIVTRLSAIEDLAGMQILCSDKTGTLTQNKMKIQEHTPIYHGGETQASILSYAAMAAKWNEPPRDALDTLTLNAVDRTLLADYEAIDYVPFDPTIKRTEGTVKNTKTGKQFKTSKGAPHIILNLCNDKSIEGQVNRDVEELGQRGIRALAVAKTDDSGKWRFMGLLTFLDPPREDTKETIERCREYKVKVKMITGDHLLIAKETARVLDLGTDISGADQLPMLDPTTKAKPDNLGQDYGELCYHSDGFAQVFPEHKFLIVEALRECGFKTGMTGDGVNDAPALKRADVGIAVEGATDAARAAADIVLTKPGLSTIVEGILLSRKIFVRIRNFITYRIAATLQLLVFFFIAVFIFKPIDYQPKHRAEIPGYPDMDYTWPSFFHMPVLMLMLITLLNDGTLIAIGYDNVNARRVPETWNLPLLFLIGAVLAGVALISSLLLLYFCLDSWNPGSFFQMIGIGGLSYGQITTSIYLKVAVSDFLTLFSARASDDWFWTTEPAPILLYAGCFALASSTILACVWPESYPDEIYTLGLEMRGFSLLPIFIWLYCIAFWFLQDAAKVYVYKFVHEHRLFEDINHTEIEFMTNPGMSSKNAAQYANKMVADDSMAFLSKSVKSGAV